MTATEIAAMEARKGLARRACRAARMVLRSKLIPRPIRKARAVTRLPRLAGQLR